MFTGIVEGLGEIDQYSRLDNERRFTIRPRFNMPDIEDGESIAINGACLSVEKHSAKSFTVYASGETVSRTTLGSLGVDSLVNLERALKLGQRLGGHIVTGHIDCLAIVTAISRRGQSMGLRLSFPANLSPQVIAKGSVCLDGISLTVNDCGRGYLEVNIIPDSQKRTNIAQWRQGSQVNMETDVIGKYVQSMLQPWQKASDSRLDINFLAANGFI